MSSSKSMEIPCGDKISFHRAVKTGNIQHVRMMRYHPALRDAMHEQDIQGNTPLHIAARLGHLDFTTLLIEMVKSTGDIESQRQKKLLEVKNANGDTFLHEAVRNGHYKLVKTIVAEIPQSCKWTNQKSESPLFVAIDNMHYRIALHIMNCPGYAIGGREGMNALHAIIIRTNEMTPYYYDPPYYYNPLRDKGEKLITKDHITKLFRDNISAIKDADHNIKWTPLHYAAFFGNMEIVKLILGKIGEPVENSVLYSVDKEGMSALHVACKTGEGNVVRAILEKCPECSYLLDQKKRTALHVAAEYGKLGVVRYLLKSSSFSDLINAQDCGGNTALHKATAERKFKCLLILAIDKRVNKVTVNNERMTALDIIQSSTIFPIRECLFERLLEFGFARSSLERATLTGDTTNPTINKEDKGDQEDITKVEGAIEERRSTYFKDFHEVNLVVASLIATVSFTAVAQLPGAYDGSGMAKLGGKLKFKIYMIANAMAFLLAACVMFINFVSQMFIEPLPAYGLIAVRISLLTISAIICMTVAFLTGISSVLENHKSLDKVIVGVEAICLLTAASHILIRPLDKFVIFILPKVHNRLSLRHERSLNESLEDRKKLSPSKNHSTTGVEEEN